MLGQRDYESDHDTKMPSRLQVFYRSCSAARDDWMYHGRSPRPHGIRGMTNLLI